MSHKSKPGDGAYGNGAKSCGGNLTTGPDAKRVAPAGRLRSIAVSLLQYLTMVRS
jgi:hypothetical protein